MQFTMTARIEKSEVYNGRTITIVTTPAPDAFSHPSKFKLYSDQALGSPLQEVEVKVNVRGVVRHKTWTDKSTGQQKKFDEDTTYLDVVDVKPAALKKAG
ncbi:hypothetical protein EDC56_2558 [Sinobacterium caligoides]|uniref:Single-stranded DNA-binding protein n=1 Tax=Sinobacterium caligoides TaxID=933926 RepID=A0A3N2DJE6_9GAMM|nr:hypothetical protein [Sinobacterium caligoides]ROR99923.1 hypothetical protein EDC56_2558 [Sinobacterium caligoides]